MFRITSVCRIAIQRLEGEVCEEAIGQRNGRPISDRARISVTRVPRTDPVFRDVATALLEAIASLEREVERLRNIIELKERGITLKPELITIGGDGLFIPKKLAFADGDRVQIYLELEQRSSHRLISLVAQVRKRTDGTELTLSQIPIDMRDLIVGYVFQQQGKERRRARNSDSSE
jgi:hypothetical protein